MDKKGNPPVYPVPGFLIPQGEDAKYFPIIEGMRFKRLSHEKCPECERIKKGKK